MTLIINKYFLDHFWTFWTKKILIISVIFDQYEIII
jgi:hypothetical protein